MFIVKEKSPRISRCTKNIVELVQFVLNLLHLNFSIISSVSILEYSVLKIFKRSLFVSFFEGFLQQILYSLGISFQILTLTPEKAFFCIFSLEYLTLKSCDCDKQVVWVWMFGLLVKSFMMLEGALSL